MPSQLDLIRDALIVDDSAIQRSHIQRLLHDLRIKEIFEARDGIEALTILEALERVPDIIIIDLEMPNMDGVELLEQLASKKILTGLVVASGCDASLITTVRLMTDELGLPLLGAVKKPVTADVLRYVVERYVHETCRHSKTKAESPEIDASLIQGALEKGLIQPWFQPKLDLISGEICGIESLARWIDPKLGVVPPNQFIPVAESSHLIFDLTLELTRQAIRRLADWRRQGIQVQMSINLSRADLERKELSIKMFSLAKEYDISPSQIMWEITESAMTDDAGSVLGTLAKLRLKGFQISIDDFGTGYSSLQQLSRMPLSELKIDKSFIKDIHEREDLRIILKSSLDMARQLKLKTVAEGIETIEDLRLLRSYKCNIGQGYLFSPAISGDEFPDWLKSNQQKMKDMIIGW